MAANRVSADVHHVRGSSRSQAADRAAYIRRRARRVLLIALPGSCSGPDLDVATSVAAWSLRVVVFGSHREASEAMIRRESRQVKEFLRIRQEQSLLGIIIVAPILQLGCREARRPSARCDDRGCRWRSDSRDGDVERLSRRVFQGVDEMLSTNDVDDALATGGRGWE